MYNFSGGKFHRSESHDSAELDAIRYSYITMERCYIDSDEITNDPIHHLAYHLAYHLSRFKSRGFDKRFGS